MLYLISYEAQHVGTEAPEALQRHLETLRAVRVLYSQWLVRSPANAHDLFSSISSLGALGPDDGILVWEINPANYAYSYLLDETAVDDLIR